MRSFTARSLALATLVPALLLFAVVPGCAKQSEGERCGDDLGQDNEDCDDGLICVNGEDFLNKSPGGHRCCYPDDRISDPRCERSLPQGLPGGGGGGGAGTGGGGAEAGEGG
jgi:hypothetical protein